MLGDQPQDVVPQGFAHLLVQRLERLQHRAVVSAEDIQPVLRRVVAEVVLAPRRLDLGCTRAEMRVKERLGAPGRRGSKPGRRRQDSARLP